MTKALISIDYTVDFVADNGRLTAAKPAQAIEHQLVNMTQKVHQEGGYIFFVIDCHENNDEFHPESKLFPPHNIIGTKGRQLYGSLDTLYQRIKEDPKVFWIDKRHYSAFSGTDLDIRLRERHVDQLILTGVLTDICVLHTAIDAYNLGYQLVIPISAVASLTDERTKWALDHFKNVLGATLID